MKLKPFITLLKMTKENIDEQLAPVRAKRLQSRIGVKKAEQEESKLGLEQEIFEMFTNKDVDVDAVLDKMDEVQLAERRIEQYDLLVKELFPSSKK